MLCYASANTNPPRGRFMPDALLLQRYSLPTPKKLVPPVTQQHAKMTTGRALLGLPG
jgi:hypothetical protein